MTIDNMTIDNMTIDNMTIDNMAIVLFFNTVRSKGDAN